MNVEFESVIKSTNISEIVDYGAFKIIRIGRLRFIPNYDGQYGRPITDLANQVLDDIDCPSISQYVNVVICSNDGKAFKNARWQIGSAHDNQPFAYVMEYANGYYTDSINAALARSMNNYNYLGHILYYV